MTRALTFLLIAFFLASSSARAVTVFASFSEAITSTSVANTSFGDTLLIEFELDNGGASLNSQTWNAGDVVSLTFAKPDESFKTVFGAETFTNSTGAFSTDGSGNLTGVPSNWTDTSVTNVLSTTSLFSPDLWFVDGTSTVYAEGFGDFSISIDNASTILSASNWNLSTTSALSPIPEPSSVALGLGLGALGLVILRRRKRT